MRSRNSLWPSRPRRYSAQVNVKYAVLDQGGFLGLHDGKFLTASTLSAPVSVLPQAKQGHSSRVYIAGLITGVLQRCGQLLQSKDYFHEDSVFGTKTEGE